MPTIFVEHCPLVVILFGGVSVIISYASWQMSLVLNWFQENDNILLFWACAEPQNVVVAVYMLWRWIKASNFFMGIIICSSWAFFTTALHFATLLSLLLCSQSVKVAHPCWQTIVAKSARCTLPWRDLLDLKAALLDDFCHLALRN